jgi:hypothetical protein
LLKCFCFLKLEDYSEAINQLHTAFNISKKSEKPIESDLLKIFQNTPVFGVLMENMILKTEINNLKNHLVAKETTDFSPIEIKLINNFNKQANENSISIKTETNKNSNSNEKFEEIRKQIKKANQENLRKLTEQPFKQLNKIIYLSKYSEKEFDDVKLKETLILYNKPKVENLNFHICKICNCIIKDPKACDNCDDLFCDLCLKSYFTSYKLKIKTTKKTKKKLFEEDNKINLCPECKHPFKEGKISKITKAILDQIVIRCPWKCQKIIRYGDLRTHFKLCKNIKKIFKCKLCDTVLKICDENELNEIEKHNVECEKLLFECGFCKSHFNKKEIGMHIVNCQERLISCENCDMVYPNKVRASHDSFFCDMMIKYNWLINEIYNE